MMMTTTVCVCVIPQTHKKLTSLSTCFRSHWVRKKKGRDDILLRRKWKGWCATFWPAIHPSIYFLGIKTVATLFEQRRRAEFLYFIAWVRDGAWERQCDVRWKKNEEEAEGRWSAPKERLDEEVVSLLLDLDSYWWIVQEQCNSGVA
jgi:hypothetical protein